MIRTLSLLSLLAVGQLLHGQNTVGLLNYNHDKSNDGYNLMFPHNQSNVYLFNNCGEIVHQWDDDTYKPGNSVHLNDQGDLYKAFGRGAVSNKVIHAGGGGEGIEIRSWDNVLKWRWFHNDSTQRLHHDIALLPNGNILAIAWELIDSADAIAQGKDTSLLDGQIWPDKIIEVKPVGSDSGQIVWEWHAMDHLVQNFDATKQNFGTPSDHPELIDFNHGNKVKDWMHANAIDYNEDYDQIMLSVPTFNEIWIIDHSTTTAEAKGHTGGASGKGGDLLFRWGNPAAYGKGGADDQRLFYQHDAHWIDLELGPEDLNYGKIMVFNNRVGANQSTVNIISPVFNSYANKYELAANGTFEPTGFEWTFSLKDSAKMHSRILSSAQRLANGNTLICSGFTGYSFEVDENDNVVWEYKTPLAGGNRVAQGTVLTPAQNLTFRMKRYPADFEGFKNRDLTAKSYLELNPDTTFCSLPTGIADNKPGQKTVLVYPNPANGSIQVQITVTNPINEWTILNAMGQVVVHGQRPAHTTEWTIDCSQWENGCYYLQTDTGENQLIMVFH